MDPRPVKPRTKSEIGEMPGTPAITLFMEPENRSEGNRHFESFFLLYPKRSPGAALDSETVQESCQYVAPCRWVFGTGHSTVA